MLVTRSKIVSVDLGERAYDIIIGEDVLTSIDSYLAPICGGKRVHIVTDETVHELHGEKLLGLEASWTILPPGEAQKSFEVLQKVLDDGMKAGLTRNDIFIAFGGGVIGDLTGFAAAIYKRGCKFIQIPTTLLAQVDSSVGGKTGINVARGKNLVGAFYQPEIVLADMLVLKTLPKRQVKAGYAEVLKYGLLGDAEFFDWLEDNGEAVLALGSEALSFAVARSCETKARIVAQDEREAGVRALLNLGHTFGHALEAEAGYDGDLLHGEAVSVGMEMAAEFSAAQDLCSHGDVKRLKVHLKKTGMPRIDEAAHLIDSDKLLTHMRQDKKNESGKLSLILMRAIGESFMDKNADVAAVHAYLTGLQKRYA